MPYSKPDEVTLVVRMKVNKTVARNVSVFWNVIVCALRKGPGVIVAQLSFFIAIPGHGSEGVKSLGLFPVGSMYRATVL